MEDKNRIFIFDTTLRDGEQCPGASLDEKSKLEIARQLAELRVDIIEAGFPITSPGDAAAVKRIAREVKGPTICALARAVQKDMDVALDSLEPAERKRLHVFLATSEIHRKHKLNKAKEEIIRLPNYVVRELPDQTKRDLDEAIASRDRLSSGAAVKKNLTKRTHFEGILPLSMDLNVAGERVLRFDVLRLGW